MGAAKTVCALKQDDRVLTACLFGGGRVQTPTHSSLGEMGNRNMVGRAKWLGRALGSSHAPPIPDLPAPSPLAQAHFTWGSSEVSSEQFIRSVNAAYSEVVHWRTNVFSVPSVRAGKAFVSELAWLFQSYAEGSALECIALTAAMILPPLLLQKPCPKSKPREHSKCLERRLKIWKAGDILSLLVEGRTIQSRLPKLHPSNTNQEHTARAFAKLMFHGRTRAALRLLTEQSVGQVLHLDKTVSQVVQTMLHSPYVMFCCQNIHLVGLSPQTLCTNHLVFILLFLML